MNTLEKLNSFSPYEAQGYNLTALKSLKEQMLKNLKKSEIALSILEFNKKWFDEYLKNDLEKHPLTHLGSIFYSDYNSLKDYVDSQITVIEKDIIKTELYIKKLNKKSKSGIRDAAFFELRIKEMQNDIVKLQNLFYKEN